MESIMNKLLLLLLTLSAFNMSAMGIGSRILRPTARTMAKTIHSAAEAAAKKHLETTMIKAEIEDPKILLHRPPYATSPDGYLKRSEVHITEKGKVFVIHTIETETYFYRIIMTTGNDGEILDLQEKRNKRKPLEEWSQTYNVTPGIWHQTYNVMPDIEKQKAQDILDSAIAKQAAEGGYVTKTIFNSFGV